MMSNIFDEPKHKPFLLKAQTRIQCIAQRALLVLIVAPVNSAPQGLTVMMSTNFMFILG